MWFLQKCYLCTIVSNKNVKGVSEVFKKTPCGWDCSKKKIVLTPQAAAASAASAPPIFRYAP